MFTVLLVGLSVGLDNLVVATSLGLLRLSWQQRLALVLGFGVCEGLAPLVGALFFQRLPEFAWVDAVAPVALIVAGALSLLGAWRGRSLVLGAGFRWLFALPLALCLDNVFAGIAQSATGTPDALVLVGVGGVSALLAAIGLYAGARLARGWPAKASLVGGLALAVCGALALVLV